MLILNSIVCWKRELILGEFSNLTIQIFDQIFGVNYFSDFNTGFNQQCYLITCAFTNVTPRVINSVKPCR